MTKIIKLNERDIVRLEYILNDNKSSIVKKRKAKTILLKVQGKSINEIIKETKLSKRTIEYYFSRYKDNPTSFLHLIKYKKSMLSSIRDDLIEEFKTYPPLSYKEAIERINDKWNIKISETQTRTMLNKYGIYTINSRQHIKLQKKQSTFPI